MTDRSVEPFQTRDVDAERMTIGLAIMAVGVVLFMGQFGGFHIAFRLWPLVLIAIGAGKLLTPAPSASPGEVGSGESRHRFDRGRKGGWLIVIGVWLLLDQLRIVRAADSWPLLLVAVGVAMIWRATSARRALSS